MFLKTFQLICQRTTASPSLILTRNYAFKTDLKVKWKKPKKISCIKPEKSGDLASFADSRPNPARFPLNYDKSEELKDSSEDVKKLFTLDLNRRSLSTEIFKKEMIDRVRRHELDDGSVESKIAKWTAQIRAMQDYMEKFPRNKIVKVQLKEMIEKRKKYLGLLRKYDYKKFEWTLEKLDLLYRSAPEKFHRITRKESLKKLCANFCENMKQEKLDNYRKTLQSQQLEFLQNKIENLEFIRNEQVECRVPVTVTVEEIKEVKKQYAELKQKRAEEEEASKKLSDKEDYELHL